MDSLRFYMEMLSVSVEVFLQVGWPDGHAPCADLPAFNAPPPLSCLQKLWMRKLPPIELVGGPASNQVCIVTGPTSGIGWETAFALAQRGAHGVAG